MNKSTIRAAFIAVTLAFSATANADFGVGFKAGTLGLGIEGRWSPIDWLDVRLGANRYDYENNGDYTGVDYNATLALDSYYITGNVRFPLSPFRLTAGMFSNGNELQMVSQDTGGANIDFGGASFDPTQITAVRGTTTFSSTAPYFGFGYDFELFDKLGLNLDFGVLWQGEPTVALSAEGPLANTQAVIDALSAEQAELQDDIDSYKAWPVISLGVVYNF